MSKSTAKPSDRRQSQDKARVRSFYATHPWQARHYDHHSELAAYVEASGRWETIVNVHQTSGASHETMALFILSIILEHQKKQHALFGAMTALERVSNDGLTFSSAQAIEDAMTEIRKVIS